MALALFLLYGLKLQTLTYTNIERNYTYIDGILPLYALSMFVKLLILCSVWCWNLYSLVLD